MAALISYAFIGVQKQKYIYIFKASGFLCIAEGKQMKSGSDRANEVGVFLRLCAQYNDSERFRIQRVQFGFKPRLSVTP